MIGVVLLNLGGPDKLEAVEPFLYNLFKDPDIINFPLSFLFRNLLAKVISSIRSGDVREKYEEIGGKSPISELTLQQAKLLEKKLNEKLEVKVYVAMRYWHPFTVEALNNIQKENISEVILLPLYPQYSIATTGSSLNEWQRNLEKNGEINYLKTEMIESYHDFEPYIEAVIERINEGLNRFSEEIREHVHLVFSAHGFSMKYFRRGDPYAQQINETVRKVIEIGGFRQPTSICYQSKVGLQKWLKPSTIKTIEKLANKGERNMLVIPIAFVSDHLETLHELDIELREIALENKVEKFEVTKGLNESEKFIDALARLVMKTQIAINKNRSLPII